MEEADMSKEPIQYDDPTERLIAEQAVLSYRESKRAMEAAPHGRGLEVTEGAVVEQGRKQTRLVMEELLRAHAEAQKGGEASCPASAGRTRR